MAMRRVVLGDLPLAERERFYEFLVANKVEFIADQSGSTFVATIRVVPPETGTARITGRARAATKQTMRRAQSAGAAQRKKPAAGNAPVQDAAATLKAAQSVLRRRYTRFCNQLPPLMAPPKALRKAALIRFAEEVYEARYEKDAQYIKSLQASGEAPSVLPQSFADFVYEFAAKRYGLKALVSSNCWGMVSTVELMRGQQVAVDLFGKFLEESYDATDLLFFLFCRSAIERVLAMSAKRPDQEADEEEEEGETGTKSKGKPQAKAKIVKSNVAPQEIQLDLRQVVQVVKMSVDSKRQDLRDRIIRSLDNIMAAKSEGATRKSPTLEPDRLLAVATEEYHNARDLRGEGDDEDDESTPEGKLKIAKAAAELPKEKDLGPEIKKEVRQVTARLMTTLSANGEKDVNPQQVYDWALQVTLRRHKLGEFLEEPNNQATSMELQQMQLQTLGMGEQQRADKKDVFVPSDDVLGLSPEEFERNLESNVRQLLLNATYELVSDNVNQLPGKTWKTDEEAVSIMKSNLISEFAPKADILMEAIVSKDYKRWLDTMKIEGNGTQKHRQSFENLHEEFQNVLNAEITPAVVQRICRAVVNHDELHEIVRARAEELVRSQGEADDSSDDDDVGLGGTASFGADNF